MEVHRKRSITRDMFLPQPPEGNLTKGSAWNDICATALRSRGEDSPDVQASENRNDPVGTASRHRATVISPTTKIDLTTYKATARRIGSTDKTLQRDGRYGYQRKAQTLGYREGL
jgi:hypothetical protein